jgi:SpoIIAA-like
VIEMIAGLPDGVLGIEAKGEVTAEDYEQVLIPAVERQLDQHDKVRLLYLLGSEFDGYSAAALWDDTKVGMEHLLSWERIAVVTDHDSYRRLVKGFGFLMPGKVRVFDVAELEVAKAWISEVS